MLVGGDGRMGGGGWREAWVERVRFYSREEDARVQLLKFPCKRVGRKV